MDTQRTSKVYSSLVHWRSFQFKVFIEGIGIGLIAGIITVLFRYLIEQAEMLRAIVYVKIHTNYWFLGMWLIVLLFILHFATR
jgi:hypothetical protein